jgi:glycosyltransferase involved in cell wall biosynthesis
MIKFPIDELSIIVLVYNEEKSIKKDIEKIITEILEKIDNSELLIIEDHSNDRTLEILDLFKNHKKISILRKEKRLGYRNSLIYGLKKSSFKNIFFTESGSKYNFSEFLKFSQGFHTDKIFSGYRSPRHDSLVRKFLTYSLNFLIRSMFSIKIYDADSGYKLMSKKYFEYYIDKCNFKNFGSAEMMIRMILNNEKIEEKKVTYYQRPDSSKQFNFFKIIVKSLKLIIDLIKLRQESKN